MRRLLAFHRWLGLLTSLLVVLPALTAIALNHRAALGLSPVDKPPTHPLEGYVLCAATDPQAPDHLWVGTAESLFRSSDGGRTFGAVALPVSASQIDAIVFDGRGTVYVALRYDGIFKSNDDGARWSAVPLPEKAQVNALSLSGDDLVAITDVGIFRGTTLLRRPPAAPSSGRDLLRLAYNLHDGNFWGHWGVWVTDLASVAILVLAASGVVLFFAIPRGRVTRKGPRAA